MGVIARPEGGQNWEGPARQAFALLADLPDNAGADAFWKVFSRL
jgi:hypothetical protein